jgi:uncharacterized membrane protein
MLDFFLLGLVPGTNIQITFVLWLYVVAIFCLPICVRQLAKRRQAAAASRYIELITI